MAAPELPPAAQKFGFKTRLVVNPVTDTILTTPTEILKNNPDRVYWLIVNLSAYDGYACWDREVSATKGILLPANGGYASASAQEDGELVIYPVYAVNLTAAGTWLIVEVERV